MRFSVTALLFAALSAFSIAPVLADPTSDISQMRKSFAALHSVHADITSKNGTVSVDMVQPNKYRVSSRGMQMIVIGATQWYNMGGQWRVIPMPNAAMTQMDAARTAGFERSLMSDYTVTDAGMDTVRGVSAHKYHLVNKKNGNTLDVWGSNNLPVRIVSGRSTIDYSQYNTVADITAPM